jgi:hypothetical protein
VRKKIDDDNNNTQKKYGKKTQMIKSQRIETEKRKGE